MTSFQDIIDEAINEIKVQITNEYGAPEGSDNADKLNNDLQQFVVAVAQRAMGPIQDYVRRLENKPVSAISDSDIRLRTMEAKMDRMLAMLSRSTSAPTGPTSTVQSVPTVSVVETVEPMYVSATSTTARTTKATKSTSIGAIVALDTSNPWGQYQKVWNIMKAKKSEPVPAHAGERSKLCSADYKNIFKKLTPDQQLAWLQMW